MDTPFVETLLVLPDVSLGDPITLSYTRPFTGSSCLKKNGA